MKGAGKESIWHVVSIIVLVLTGILFWQVFSPSDCDNDAKVTMNEIKRAIECAAKYSDYKDPITGKPCNEAVIKLCQMSGRTLTGQGFLQSYYGLSVPDYMIYYKKFPKKDVKEAYGGAPFYIKWSESYPLERMGVGERIWDRFRLTLTMWKDYSKLRYLDKGCTDKNGLCFNVRGREEVVYLDTPEYPVKIKRDEILLGFEQVKLHAEGNPTFYLVSPCYGKIIFTRKGNSIIGNLEKYKVGASNYCFADSDVITGAGMAYVSEVLCTAADLVLSILTGGVKTAAREGVETGTVIVLKEAGEEVTEKGLKTTSKQVWKKFTKEGLERGTREFIEKGAKETAEEGAEFAVKEIVESRGYYLIGDQLKNSVYDAFLKEGPTNAAKFIKRELYEEFGGKVKKEVIDEVVDASIKEAVEQASAKAIVGDILDPVTDKIIEKLKNKGIVVISEKKIKESIRKKLEDEAFEKIMRKGILTHVLKTTVAGKFGIPTNKKRALGMLGIPCLDVDYCRGLGACIETFVLWPGYPFTDLTSEDMKGEKHTYGTADYVFVSCCDKYNRLKDIESNIDPDYVICEAPYHILSVVRRDVDPKRYEQNKNYDLNLTALAKYLQIEKSSIDGLCSLQRMEYMKECPDSLESRRMAKELGIQEHVGKCFPNQTMTFDFDRQVDVSTLVISMEMLGSKCNSNVILQFSKDCENWEDIKILKASDFEELETEKLTLEDVYSFRCVRLKEEPAAAQDYCYISYASVTLNPYTEVTNAVKGKKYTLEPHRYTYFITPDDYETTAFDLCYSIKYCDSISAGDVFEGTAVKFFSSINATNFTIGSKEKIGIFVTSQSSVTFENKE